MRLGAILLAAAALTGCGGHGSTSPESVARAWSAALDRNDNESAANLFADDAKIVQGGELDLRDHAAAVQWNAMLPCGGTITSVTTQSKTDVLVVFKLEGAPAAPLRRPGHPCGGAVPRSRREDRPLAPDPGAPGRLRLERRARLKV